jgi:hypothetical protein
VRQRADFALDIVTSAQRARLGPSTPHLRRMTVQKRNLARLGASRKSCAEALTDSGN